MAPDTQQNLIYTVYFIVIHNALPILYSLGLLVVTASSLKKPTRGKILILWGIVILFFVFEYNKHILEGIKDQTLNSLVTERQSIKIEYVVTKFFTKIIPFVLPVIGWSLIIGGIFFDKIFLKIRALLNK